MILLFALLGCADAPLDADPVGTDSVNTVESVDTDVSDTIAQPFVLTSPAFTDVLPVDYTCDGAGHSPPLAWTGVPDGVAELAVMAGADRVEVQVRVVVAAVVVAAPRVGS